MNRRRFLRSASAVAATVALPPYAGLANAAAPAESPLARGRPSATAQGAAILRAAHQLLDEPRVFADPFALRIIGEQAEHALRDDPERFSSRRSLRAFVALRSRYAEDQLASAVRRGVRQYVVLGAGLDTFSLRNAYPGMAVFEVDHPATQRWKQQRLREAGLRTPESLRFASVDFESETLSAGLLRAGFLPSEPAFFSMLGVAIYLTKNALMETLKFVSASVRGSEIVFDYSIPSELLTDAQRLGREKAAARAGRVGEPWISYFDPRTLAVELSKLGFSNMQDLGPAEANARYFADRNDLLRVSGSGRLASARVSPCDRPALMR